MSRIDYCNSALAGLPQTTTAPLQRVQNAAARLVIELGPMGWRVQFKLCCIMHSIFRDNSLAGVPDEYRSFCRCQSICSGQNFPPTTHCLAYEPSSASVLSHTLVPQLGTHCRRTFMRHQTLLSLQDSSKLIILAELLMSFNSCFTDSWNATAFMV